MIIATFGKALVMTNTDDRKHLITTVYIVREYLPMNSRQLVNLCYRFGISYLWVMPYCETAIKAKLDPDLFFRRGYPLSGIDSRSGQKYRIVFAVGKDDGTVQEEIQALYAIVRGYNGNKFLLDGRRM